MLEPVGDHEVEVLHAIAPHVPPPIAHERRVRRPAEQRVERRAPVERVGEQRSAHVVHVVGVAIVGRAGRDDRFQRRRPERRDLERVEAAPGVADHADAATAPRLLSEPLDRRCALVQFLRQVLVGHDAVAVAGAAHVDPDGDIAVAGEPPVHRRVADGRELTFSIRQVFEDRGVARGRSRARVLGQEDPRRHPVRRARHRQPGVLDLADVMRQITDDAHDDPPR